MKKTILLLFMFTSLVCMNVLFAKGQTNNLDNISTPYEDTGSKAWSSWENVFSYEEKSENEGVRYGVIIFDNSQYDKMVFTFVNNVLTEYNVYFKDKSNLKKAIDSFGVKSMQGNVLIDGRNIYDPDYAKALGFTYLGFGRGYNGME